MVSLEEVKSDQKNSHEPEEGIESQNLVCGLSELVLLYVSFNWVLGSLIVEEGSTNYGFLVVGPVFVGHGKGEEDDDARDDEEEGEVEEDHDEVAGVVGVGALFLHAFEISQRKVVVLEDDVEQNGSQKSSKRRDNDVEPNNSLEIEQPDNFIWNFEFGFPLVTALQAAVKQIIGERDGERADELNHELSSQEFNHVLRP